MTKALVSECQGGAGLFHLLSCSSSAFPQASAPSVGLWDDPAPAQNEAQSKSRAAPSTCSQCPQVCPQPGHQASAAQTTGTSPFQQLETSTMDPFPKHSQVPQPQPPSETSASKPSSLPLPGKSSEASSWTAGAAGIAALQHHPSVLCHGKMQTEGKEYGLIRAGAFFGGCGVGVIGFLCLWCFVLLSLKLSW